MRRLPWSVPRAALYGAGIGLVAALVKTLGPFHAADKVVLYGAGLALLWYVAALYWRLKRGVAGVKPVEDLID